MGKNKLNLLSDVQVRPTTWGVSEMLNNYSMQWTMNDLKLLNYVLGL